MIRLFASDLDGTLLNLLHEVDAPIRAALLEVVASGARFAVATGRTMRSSARFGFDGVACECVCSNGALVYDREGRLVRSRPLDPAFLEELLRAFPAVPFDCVGMERNFVRGSREAHEAGFASEGGLRRLAMRVVMRGMRATRASEGETLFDRTDADVLAQPICKVNARLADAGMAAELHAFLDEHASEAVNAPFNPSMFEITGAGVDKGSAVAWLAEWLGIGPDEVAVYGDGGNDVAMLRRFSPYGHAYATRCACDAARAAANACVGSNVLHAVPRHMLRTLRAQQRA